MAGYELYKIWIKQKGIWAVLLLMMIKFVTLGLESPLFNSGIESHKAAYTAYMQDKTGPLTPATERAIISDRDSIADAESDLSDLFDRYEQGLISGEDYYQNAAVLNQKTENKTVVDLAYQEYQYAAQNPARRYLMYTNGWECFIGTQRVDYPLLLALACLLLPLFCMDHESGAHSLVAATRRGKRRLCATRLAVSLSTAALLCMLFYAAEAVFFSLTYGLPHADYPVQSVHAFQNSPFYVSTGQMAAIIGGVKLLGTLAFTALLALTGALAKAYFPALVTAGMAVVLPDVVFHTDVVRYAIPPLGLLAAGGYFRGECPLEITDIAVVTSAFPAIDPWFVYWSLAAGFALIVLGVVFTQAAYTDRCLFSRMDKRRVLAPALAGALLCAVCLWGVTDVSSPLPQASQAEYSRYTRFTSGDGEHMYYIHTDLTPDVREELRAVDNVTLKEEAVVRDPMKSFQTVNSWFYVDDRYIYYAICNNLFGDSSGELNVYRVDKATYAETLVYTEADEAWGGGNTTRYLGIVNVDGYGNLTATEKNEKSLTDMWVDGDNLFLADRRYVYRIDLKTGDKQTVWEGTRYQENMAYSGGTLYYVDRLHDAYGVDTNTQKRTKLAIPKATEVFPYHGDLYFIDTQGHIGAYDAQKQQYTIFSQNQVLSWSNVSGGNGWLYFFNEENVLCRVSTDGKEETLPQYGHVTDCAAFDGSDWLYISRLEGEDVISGFVAAP